MKFWRQHVSVAAAVVVTIGLFGGSAHSTTMPVTCVAHRGSPTTHTEETMPTYEAALDAGAATIEGDVRWTSTDMAVMNHDATLTRFGHSELAVADLTQTQATGYASETGDHMATLWQVGSAVLAHPGSRLEAELKVPPTPAQWSNLASRLDRLAGRVTITSFSLTVLRAAQDHGYPATLNSTTTPTTTAARTVSESDAAITVGGVAWLAERGVATEAWSADDGALDYGALAAKGVTIMLTNDVIGCEEWSARR